MAQHPALLRERTMSCLSWTSSFSKPGPGTCTNPCRTTKVRSTPANPAATPHGHTGDIGLFHNELGGKVKYLILTLAALPLSNRRRHARLGEWSGDRRGRQPHNQRGDHRVPTAEPLRAKAWEDIRAHGHP